jgi:ubiquitin carboxyl-terminal hydrolase 14
VSLIDRLFNIKTEVTYKNREVPEEPEQVRHEDILKLSAHIEGGPEVTEMMAGIKVSFTGEVEKRSETLQRDCIYEKKTEIAALPSYLCVNFVRFYWKRESAVSGTKAGKAKILKAVAFPKVFDCYSLCTRDL